MRQVLFVPIIGTGRDEDAFRADLDNANGMVSASIGSILTGNRRGQPKHDWTLVRADLQDQREVPILRPASLRDFDEEMPASDKAKLPDFVQDKRTYRAIVMEMLGRQYDYADERMLDTFIQRAVGPGIRGGAHGSGFVVDHFTDTDGTLLENHSPDTGSAWEQLAFSLGSYSGDIEVQSNRIQSAASGSASYVYRNNTTPSVANYVVSAQWHSGTGESHPERWGLLGRISATGTARDDYYMFQTGFYDNALGSILQKSVSGSTTTLASTNPVTEGVAGDTTYSVAFDITDGIKEGTVEGVYSLSSADNDVTAVGRVGVFCPRNFTGAWVDDFLAEEVPITISSVTPSAFDDGDTGVTITGSGFEASQNTGKVELGDSSDYATATLVEQTITSWGDTSIDFTVDQGALATGAAYVFVTNDSGDRTSGFEVELTTLMVLTETLQDAALDTAYSDTLTANGGTEPYTWAITAGQLPTGLSLNSSTGEISGTPTQQESQTFTVEVTDDNSDTDTQELTITVVVAGTGTIYRRQDSNNYWRVRLDSGTAYLEKVDAGTLSLVDSAAATFTAASKLKVLASGSRHRVYVDDELVLDATDSHLSDATGVGLYSEDDTTVGVESIYVYRA